MFDTLDISDRKPPLSKFKVGQEVNVLTNGERWRGRIVAYRGRLFNGQDFFEITFGEVDDDGRMVLHGYPPGRLEALT